MASLHEKSFCRNTVQTPFAKRSPYCQDSLFGSVQPIRPFLEATRLSFQLPRSSFQPNFKLTEINSKLSSCLELTDTLLMENESLKQRISTFETQAKNTKPLKVIKLKSRLRSECNNQDLTPQNQRLNNKIRLKTERNDPLEMPFRDPHHKSTFTEARWDTAPRESDPSQKHSLNSTTLNTLHHTQNNSYNNICHTRSLMELLNPQPRDRTSRDSVSPSRTVPQLEEKLRLALQLYKQSISNYGELMKKLESQMVKIKLLERENKEMKQERERVTEALKDKTDIIRLKDMLLGEKTQEILGIQSQHLFKTSRLQQSIENYDKELSKVKNQLAQLKVRSEMEIKSERGTVKRNDQQSRDQSVECHLIVQPCIHKSVQAADNTALDTNQLIQQIVEGESRINILEQENLSLNCLVQQLSTDPSYQEPTESRPAMCRSLSLSPTRDFARLEEQNRRLLAEMLRKDIVIVQLTKGSIEEAEVNVPEIREFCLEASQPQ